MQNATHTSGNWEVIHAPDDEDGGKNVYVGIKCKGTPTDYVDRYICRVDWQHDDEDGANTALIAAAPDLLAALKTLLWACRDGAVLPRDSAHAQALAAISKANPCSHNIMAENIMPDGTPNMEHPWKCADCGYVYQ